MTLSPLQNETRKYASLAHRNTIDIDLSISWTPEKFQRMKMKFVLLHQSLFCRVCVVFACSILCNVHRMEQFACAMIIMGLSVFFFLTMSRSSIYSRARKSVIWITQRTCFKATEQCKLMSTNCSEHEQAANTKWESIKKSTLHHSTMQNYCTHTHTHTRAQNKSNVAPARSTMSHGR